MLFNPVNNIPDANVRRVRSAESGTPLFEMDLIWKFPVQLSEDGLMEELRRLANKLEIDLVLRRTWV